jgi:hypothetical protein
MPGRPALLNAERAAHWREHRARTKDIRLEARLRWMNAMKTNAGRMACARAEVYPTYARGPLPDTGACIPAVKAIVDGAVDAGLLLDDGPEIITRLTFHRPITDKDRGDGVYVILDEYPKGDPWP